MLLAALLACDGCAGGELDMSPIEGEWHVHIEEEALAKLEKMREHAEANPDDPRAAMMVDMLTRLSQRQVDIGPDRLIFLVMTDTTVIHVATEQTEAGWQASETEGDDVYTMTLVDDGMMEFGKEGKKQQLWKRP